MEILFILNFIVSLGICLFLVINHLKFHKTKEVDKVLVYFSFIGALYLFIALSSLLWFFNFLNYLKGDFLFMYAVIIVVQSLLLFKIIYLISPNKKLFTFLLFYAVSILPLFYSVSLFLNLIIIVSFLMMLLFFLSLTFKRREYRIFGYFGMFYSILGVIFQLSWDLGFGRLYFFNLILNVIFFFLVYLLIENIKKNPSLLGSKKISKRRPVFVVILSHLFFVIIFINFVLIGTIGLHEVGHLTVSNFYDCGYRKIVYEESFFHTEIVCNNSSGNVPVLIGGIILPFALAFILFFLGGKFMKEMALLLVGFNMLSLTSDLRSLGLSDNLIFGFLFVGGIAFALGVVLIAKFRIEDDIYILN